MAQLSALGTALRAHRKSLGWSQADAARRAAIGISALRNLEAGAGTLTSLRAMLAAYGAELRGRSLAAGEVHVALRALRQRRSLSRRELARTLGVSRTTLAVLEAGGAGRLPTLEAYGLAVGAGLYVAAIGAPVGFFVHAGTSSAHHGWETPPELAARLEAAVGGFDLDPCAASADRKRARIKARVLLTLAEDGLAVPWRGRVFVNPPYGSGLGRWVAKCAHEAAQGAVVVGLVPARTDTRWWHGHVAGQADVFLLRGRLRFGDSDVGAPFPSAVVVWGGGRDLAARLGQELAGAWHIPRGSAD